MANKYEKYVNKHIYENIFDFSFIKDEILQKEYVKEFQVWVSFIDKLIKDVSGIHIYVKGGTPLGIELLKRVIFNYKGNDIKTKVMEVLNMNLIRDWDFMTVINSNLSFSECIKNYDIMEPFFKKKEVDLEKFRKKNTDIVLSDLELQPCLKLHEIMRVAKKHNIKKEGVKMIIIRKKNCVKINEDAFFEMMIKTEDTLSEIELPLTTMKILLTSKNYKYLFFLSKLIYMATHFGVNIDKYFDMIKFMLGKIEITIKPHDKDGFLQTNKDTYDAKNLSLQIQQLLERKLSNYNDRQFIVSQFVHPDSIFYRLLNKNIPKSDKIRNYLTKLKLKTPTYLVNSNRAKQVVKIFLDSLSINMNNIHEKYNFDNIEATIKIYYDIKNNITNGSIKIISNDDIEQMLSKYDDDFKNNFYMNLNKLSKKRLNSVCQKVLDITDYLYLELVKKMQDKISDMLIEYDNFFMGVNIGRLNSQFNEIINTENSKVLLSRISIQLSDNVAERIRVSKNFKSAEFLYKLSKLEYDENDYNNVLNYQ